MEDINKVEDKEEHPPVEGGSPQVRRIQRELLFTTSPGENTQLSPHKKKYLGFQYLLDFGRSGINLNNLDLKVRPFTPGEAVILESL